MINLDKLERDAGQATAGEWEKYSGQPSVSVVTGPGGLVEIASVNTWGPCGMRAQENATHIANMDPPTTLALIKAVRELAHEVAAKNVVDILPDGTRVYMSISDILADHGLEGGE